MPTYTFITKKGKIIEVELSITQYDSYKLAHPELQRYFDTVPFVSFNGRSFGGLDAKTDNTWKERLAKIGEKFPGSPLADNYNKKTDIKKVKTKEIIKKHAKKFESQVADRLKR